MLSFKNNCRLTGLSPQMAMAAMIVEKVFDLYANTDAMITSVNDSTHGATSLHAFGRAMDFRTKHLFVDLLDRKDRLNTFRLLVIKHLTSEFDVVLEDIGSPNEHMHVEYDPKPAASQTKA